MAAAFFLKGYSKGNSFIVRHRKVVFLVFTTNKLITLVRQWACDMHSL